MDLQPKKIIQYAKMGFVALKTGKGVISLVLKRLPKKYKRKNTRSIKDKIQKAPKQLGNAFFSTEKEVKRQLKMGRSAFVITNCVMYHISRRT
ncbi:MAG: hypothetical protein ACK5I7_02540 [Anaerotignum sp.]